MKKSLLATLYLVSAFWSFGQTTRSQFIGINVLQLTALTINANYTLELMPSLTPSVESGYAFNYEKSFDIGDILTPHCKCNNDGYNIEKLNGAYLKIGTFLNLRKSVEKQNFFHIGIFLNNSIVYESGVYNEEESELSIQHLSHTIYVTGLSFSGGYEFLFFKKMKSNIDFQISLPGKSYEDLYGYRNYIPGFGYRDSENYWFPMLLWNIKYKL